jgi:hypothetical protein
MAAAGVGDDSRLVCVVCCALEVGLLSAFSAAAELLSWAGALICLIACCCEPGIAQMQQKQKGDVRWLIVNKTRSGKYLAKMNTRYAKPVILDEKEN